MARYGGEEFAMILPATSLEEAVQVAEKVRQTVSQLEIAHAGERIHITVSGGLATIQIDEQSESMVQRADEALYAAKAGGRNCTFQHDGTSCLSAAAMATRPKVMV